MGIKTSELDIARYNTLMKKLMCLELIIWESLLSASGSNVMIDLQETLHK